MRIKKGFELRRVGNENIVVAGGMENIDFSRIISMNASSAWLWKQVEGQEFDENTLFECLLSQYDVDAGIARRDAAELMEQWLSAGIIE